MFTLWSNQFFESSQLKQAREEEALLSLSRLDRRLATVTDPLLPLSLLHRFRRARRHGRFKQVVTDLDGVTAH